MDPSNEEDAEETPTRRGGFNWLDGLYLPAEGPPAVMGIAILLAIALLPVLGIAFVLRGGKSRPTDDLSDE